MGPDEADLLFGEKARKPIQADALTLEHQLTHKPKNPYCEFCCRGKMRHKRKLAGSFRVEAAAWGDHLTADHITSIKDRMLGVTDDKDVFVVRDPYSGLKHPYPLKTKSAAGTETSIQHFRWYQEWQDSPR